LPEEFPADDFPGVLQEDAQHIEGTILELQSGPISTQFTRRKVKLVETKPENADLWRTA
jgi:hypothetical protein